LRRGSEKKRWKRARIEAGVLEEEVAIGEGQEEPRKKRQKRGAHD
jgi:hypothetical protein